MKLNDKEQEIFFEKLDIYENYSKFWGVVRQFKGLYKNKSVVERALNEWFQFLNVEDGSLKAISRWKRIELLDILEFKEFLHDLNAKGEKRTEHTVQQRMLFIKKLSERLFNYGLLPVNAWINYKIKYKVNAPYKAPMLTEEEIKKIFNSCDLRTTTGERDYCVFACLLGAGLRLRECSNLKCKDVSRTQKGKIYLRLLKTKNQKNYIQPLPEFFGKKIFHFKIKVENKFGKNSYLFTKQFKNGKVKELSYAGLRKLIQRRFEKLGIEYGRTHSFRVTAITKLLQEKVPIQEVRKFARHESILTTDLYNRDVNLVDEKTLSILDIKEKSK